MVYATRRRETILFGCQGAAGNLDDTWEWNGANWLQKTVINSPPGRYWHSMAYDSIRQKIIIFGGWNSPSNLDDTWEYP